MLSSGSSTTLTYFFIAKCTKLLEVRDNPLTTLDIHALLTPAALAALATPTYLFTLNAFP